MSSLETRTDRFFSVWLITGFLLYAFGFFLAPSSKAQYLTLYIGLILPALYFSFFHFKQYYLENNRALLWILFITIALYLPSAWADGDTQDTLRKNLKGVYYSWYACQSRYGTPTSHHLALLSDFLLRFSAVERSH